MQSTKGRRLKLRGCCFLLCLVVAGRAAASEDVVRSEDVVVTATKTSHSLEEVPVKTEIVTRQEIEERQFKTLQDWPISSWRA